MLNDKPKEKSNEQGKIGLRPTTIATMTPPSHKEY